MLSDIGWLAGRGYNIAIVRVPTRWRGQENITGAFVPVLWESMAEPILTGRDELGWPKIFADIPAPVVENGNWQAHAAWEGFAFLEMSAGCFAALTEQKQAIGGKGGRRRARSAAQCCFALGETADSPELDRNASPSAGLAFILGEMR